METYAQYHPQRQPSSQTPARIILVDSNPTGAVISVDDGEPELVTPTNLRITKPGMTMVRLQKPGFKDTWVFIGQWTKPQVKVSLEKL
jgi:hypothetical protein